MRSPLARRWFVLIALILTAGSRPAVGQDVPAIVVEGVAADSVGAKAGFAIGDRVLTYDARPLSSPAALQAAEENIFKSEITVRLRRGNETLTLAAPGGRLGLGVRPAMSPEVVTLYEEGQSAQRSKQIDVTAARWTAAAQAAHAAGDTVSAAWLYERVGGLHDNARKWKEAAAAHRAAWDILQHGSDAAAQSRTLTALGRSSQSASDFPTAQRWYEQAAAVDRAAGNEWWLADALNSRGSVAYSRGDLVVALESFTTTLAIRQRLEPESLEVAAALSNLGSVANERGDQAEAHDYHSRALALRERLAPASRDVAASLNNLGQVAYARGDLEAAGLYHDRAIRIKERVVPDSLSLALSLNNRANVARALGDEMAAQSYHTRALRIREALAPGSLEVATSLNNLGNILSARGDLDGAQDHHRRALAIRERLAPDSLNVSSSLNNLGELAHKRGDFSSATDLHRRALAIREKRAPESLAVAASLANLGVVAASAGETTAARHLQVRALAIRERLAPDSLVVARSLNYLGTIAFKEQRVPDALPLFARAVAIVEKQRWQIRFAESRALLMEEHTAAYVGSMRAHVAMGDVAAAFAMAERLRARSLLDILAEGSSRIRQQVDPPLLARERRLQEEINAKADRQLQVLGGSHTTEQAAAATQDLDRALVQYRELQAQIRKADPRYGALTQPEPIGLAEVQRNLLDDKTVLLEYVLGDEGSHVFAVTSTSSGVVALPGRSEVDAAARRVYELMTARQPVRGETPAARKARIDEADAEYPAAAAVLSRMVLGPVADRIGNRRLLIVADGALQYVPFAALPDPATAAQPLIVDHEIVNLPSASVLAVLREPSRVRAAPDQLVAVVADPVFDAGDPRMQRAGAARADRPVARVPADVAEAVRAAGLADDRGTLARLPFTRDEARAIVAITPGGRATQAVDFKASRATVTGPDLGRARVVHLATHGLLDTEHPELSGLVLSLVDEQGQAQDGFLRLHEIYNLEWAAELVVLSACQTGLGKEIRGEGLVGLTRGFMYAGAERVMASLWNVNDSVTAQMMRRFYEGLFTKKLSPAAALRAAQVEMWEQRQWRAP